MSKYFELQMNSGRDNTNNTFSNRSNNSNKKTFSKICILADFRN